MIKRSDQNAVHRKVFAPWYDTEAVCVITMFLMFLVFLFSLTGVSVCGENPEFREHVWMPFVLLFASSIVLVSIAIRLGRRIVSRYQGKYPVDFSSDGLE